MSAERLTKHVDRRSVWTAAVSGGVGVVAALIVVMAVNTLVAHSILPPSNATGIAATAVAAGVLVGATFKTVAVLNGGRQ